MPEIDWPQFTAGLILCLGGWTLYWAGIHMAGGVIGAAAGFAVAMAGSALIELDTRQMWWIPYLGGLAGFVGGIFLIRGLHRFFFFFVGATLGVALGKIGYDYQAGEQWVQAHPKIWQTVFIAAGSILGGMSMVWGSRWIVALVTAVSGSFLVVMSIADPLALLGFIPLVPTSFFFQIGCLRRLSPKPRAREEEMED